MPFKGTKKMTTAQRAKLAAGKLNNTPLRDIAKDTGLALSTVAKQIHDARTGSLFLDYKLKHQEEWEKSLTNAHKKLDELLKSKDDTTALRAAVSIMRASVLGDVAIKPEPPKDETKRRGDFTLEELLTSFRQGVELARK